MRMLLAGMTEAWGWADDRVHLPLTMSQCTALCYIVVMC